MGSPLQTWLSSHLFKARKPALILSSVVSLGIASLLVMRTADLSLPSLVALCLLMGAFTSASVVIGFSATKELFPKQITGTAIGLINLFPFAGGAIFQPLLGMILQHHTTLDGSYAVKGYQQAFSVLLGCTLIALLASLLSKETLRPTSADA